MNSDSRILRQARAVIGTLLCLAASSAALASKIPGYPDDFRRAYDPREVALLPPYCKYTLNYRDNLPGGKDAAAISHMYATYGQGFHALHHYCWAIIATHRGLYLARTKQLREFYLKEAIDDINYVLVHTPPDFVLLPELLTAKARIQIHLGSGGSAVVDLLRAIEIKPDYWPPYAVLSDYYRESGARQEARKVLERGLQATGESRALRKRLDALEEPKDRPAPRPARHTN